eukprot:Gb_05396 [translate_table: standard]
MMPSWAPHSPSPKWKGKGEAYPTTGSKLLRSCQATGSQGPTLTGKRDLPSGKQKNYGGLSPHDGTTQCHRVPPCAQFKENIIPLSHQIQQFANISSVLPQKHGVDAARSFLSKSLYAVSAGGNDIGLNYLTNATFQNTTSPQDLVKLLLTKYSEYLSSLYRSGARNFILLDIGPLGCTPNSRLAGLSTWNGRCLKIANQLAMAFNSGLRVLTSNLNQHHKGALTILSTDFYGFVLSIIQHGRAYGKQHWEHKKCP